MYLNKAYLIGNLTRDPELRSLPSGMQVCQFSVATNRVYKDKNGARQEATDYHNVVAFGRQGELCAQYLRKGSQAFIEGRMQTRSWEQDGQKKYRTEVVADRVQFGNRPGGGAMAGGPMASTEDGPAQSKGPAAQNDDGAIDYPEEEINPEDIPF